MADDAPVKSAPGKPAAPAAEEEPHYEEVSEYRIGEGPPPLFLILFFCFVITWACFAWIPFFGY